MCSKLMWMVLFSLVLLKNVKCSIHNISIYNDARKYIPLSTFGFFKDGELLVDIRDFSFSSRHADIHPMRHNFGFSLQRTKSDGLASFMEKKSSECTLFDQDVLGLKDLTMITFQLDLGDEKEIAPRINATIYSKTDFDFRKIDISDKIGSVKNENLPLVEWFQMNADLAKSQLLPEKCKIQKPNNKNIFNLTYDKESESYSGAFRVLLNCPQQAGLYNLYFHNCMNYKDFEEGSSVNLNLTVIEMNRKTYLSAGKIPLPTLYFFMSLNVFAAAIVWTVFLRKRSQWTYKIHWLMAMVVYFKALSLLTHGLSFYYTGKNGIHVGSWAILYYIIHLFKGALLFATIVLIGTGYFFIKHVLSSKEKKLFLVVIPLQIIANVTQTIMDSTEEGNKLHYVYFKVALAVDLICCGAILLPVIWSIKHLAEAAKTDGKAAISLRKLKLFRQFYIMIVCYIYFTRIIVQLMKVTVPFQFMWLCELFSEAATYFFYVLTGWKFRPVNDNPYLHLPQDDDDEEDIEMNDISTYSPHGESVNRVNRTNARKT